MSYQTGYADVNDTRLYYETAGSGQPLVLIHGFTLDRRMWQPQFETLAQQFQVIAYDMRGFGRSALPTSAPYTHHDDLKALLDHLALPQAHVIGLSLGGAVAVDFTLAYPGSVTKLVTVDAALSGYQWSPAWFELTGPVWKLGRSGDLDGARNLWLASPLFSRVPADPTIGAAIQQMVAGYSGWHWQHRDPDPGLTPPAAGRLAEIGSPTLVLVGEHDQADFQGIADLLAQTIPQAQKITVPGAGHMANMERPDYFNRVLLEFLNN